MGPWPMRTAIVSSETSLCKVHVWCSNLESRTGPGQSKADGGRQAWNSAGLGQWLSSGCRARNGERHTAELGLTGSCVAEWQFPEKSSSKRASRKLT